jgi:hypothetical protein
MNPRITFTVSDETMKQIEEYRFEYRMRNQTQAVLSLIDLGFKALTGEQPKNEPQFTEDELHIMRLYKGTDPLYQGIVVKIMQDNQVEKKERHA